MIIENFWYFIIYAFLGWVLEVVYCTVTDRKIVNRGFLNGPVCPIYGFGMIAILQLLMQINDDVTKVDVVTLFFGGMILSTIIELVGGWALMKCFHTRWWDYSERKYNFHGYICLRFSLAWGVGSIIAIKLLHNTILRIVSYLMAYKIFLLLLGFLYLVFITDFMVTVLIVLGVNKKLKEIDEIKKELIQISDEMSERIGTQALEMDDRKNMFELRSYEKYLDLVETSEEFKEASRSAREAFVQMNAGKIREYEEKCELIKNKIYKNKFFGFARIQKAFPTMRSLHYDHILDELRRKDK